MLNIIRNIFNVLQCKTYKQTNENNTKQQKSKIFITGTATIVTTTMVINRVKKIKENNNVSVQSEPGKETKRLPTQLEHHMDEISSDANNNTDYLNTAHNPEEEILIPAKEDQTSSSNEKCTNNSVNSVIESLSYILAEHDEKSHTEFIKQKEKIVQDISDVKINTCADLDWEAVDKKLDIIFDPSSPREMPYGLKEILPQYNAYIVNGCSLNSSMACAFALFAKYLKPCVKHINDIKNATVDLDNNITDDNRDNILFFGKWLYIFFSIIDVQNINQVSKMLLILLIQLKIIDNNNFIDKAVNLWGVSDNLNKKLNDIICVYITSIESKLIISYHGLSTNATNPDTIKQQMTDTEHEIIQICIENCNRFISFYDVIIVKGDKFFKTYNYTNYKNIKDYRQKYYDILFPNVFPINNTDQEHVNINTTALKNIIQNNINDIGFLMFLLMFLITNKLIFTYNNDMKEQKMIHGTWILHLFIKLIIHKTKFILPMYLDLTHNELLVFNKDQQLYCDIGCKPINAFVLYSLNHYKAMVQYKNQILMMNFGHFYKQYDWQYVLHSFQNEAIYTKQMETKQMKLKKIKYNNTNSKDVVLSTMIENELS